MKENPKLTRLQEEIKKEVTSKIGDPDPWGNGFFSALDMVEYYERFQKYSGGSFTEFVNDTLKSITGEFEYSLLSRSEKWSLKKLRNVIIQATYRCQKVKNRFQW